MDLDAAFVFSVLSGGKTALAEAQQAGFRPELLMGDGRKAYDLVKGHLDQFGDLPSVAVLEAKSGLALDAVKEPVEFFTEELINRHVYGEVSKTLDGMIKLLEDKEPQKALSMMLADGRRIQQESVTSATLQSLPGMMQGALDWYERVKNGERGILFPWNSINRSTMGLWPEDLVLFVARAGIGKTWTALLVAKEAWEAGHKVLFVTTEIAKATLALRFAATHFKLPYGQLRSGQLGEFWEDRFRAGVDEYRDDQRFMVVGGDFDFRLDTLWGYVDMFEPEVLVVDGIYLLHSEERSEKQNERAASIYNELKRGGKRFKIPIVGTTQFNRTVKKGSKEPDSDAIAQTDASGWNADAAFGLIQTKSMKKDKRMILHPMKVREGELEDTECHWDFESMDFSEMEQADVTQPPSGGGGGGPSPAFDPQGEMPF